IPDDQFEIVEVDVKRSRKSEIRRSERINVKKLSQPKRAPKREEAPADLPEKVEESEKSEAD
ncbi:MAG: hypothetical protein ACXADU_10505, partial [Promethearchaeota archaeon]